MSILRRRSPSRLPADIDLGPNAAHLTGHYGSPMGSMSPTLTQGQPQTPAAAARARVRFVAKPSKVAPRCGVLTLHSGQPCARVAEHKGYHRESRTLDLAAAARRTGERVA